MVTSTGSGLAVPDWPLSYGTLFPPMVGGIFYEHGHRMVAAFVGLLMLSLTIWLWMAEKRRWVRYLALGAFLAVVIQGLLGGITVLFFLPTSLSVSHGILAQTFFILTLFIAYSQSLERTSKGDREPVKPRILKLTLCLSLFVYLQLVIGAILRHTGSGLVIPDLMSTNGIHFIHRLGGIVIAIWAGVLTLSSLKYYRRNRQVMSLIYLFDTAIVIQFLLGILTVLTQKSPILTSFHVMMGAAVLGLSVLLFLRMAPLSYEETKRLLFT